MSLLKFVVVLFLVFSLFDNISTSSLYFPTDGNYEKPHNKRTGSCKCVPVKHCEDYNEEAGLYGQEILGPRNNKCHNNGDICCMNPVQTSNSFNNNPYSFHCGRQLNKPYRSRIISEKAAAFGELPWNLIVQEIGQNKKPNAYLCGASLIHPKVALTAAHCVDRFAVNPSRVLVRAGELNVETDDETYPFQEMQVEEVIIHENYHRTSLKNDIALLFLSKSYQASPNINTICLSNPDSKIIESRCIVSGWGKTAFKKGSYSSILRKIEVPIVDKQRCLKILRSTELGPVYRLHDSIICAGGEKDKDACKGDGGSPLICPLEDEDRWVQIGIVSGGIGCGHDGIPGIYVNVPYFGQWIEEELKYRNLDVGTYRSYNYWQ